MNENVKISGASLTVRRLYCEECGTEMSATGTVYMTAPPRYRYICTKCKSEQASTTKFPQVVVTDSVGKLYL